MAAGDALVRRPVGVPVADAHGRITDGVRIQIATSTRFADLADVDPNVRPLDLQFWVYSVTTGLLTPVSSLPVVSTQFSGTTYTFVLLDAQTVKESTGAGAAVATIPPVASVAWPVGAVIEVFQYGAGQVTIAAGAGVTLRSDGAKVKTAGQYATIGLRHRATNEWVLSGDLA